MVRRENQQQTSNLFTLQVNMKVHKQLMCHEQLRIVQHLLEIVWQVVDFRCCLDSWIQALDRVWMVHAVASSNQHSEQANEP
jgi:hypothetical protein